MSKKLLVIMSVLMVAAFVLSACAKATPVPTAVPTKAPVKTEAPTAVPTEAPTAAPKLKVCEVTDTGGVDDKSFNATAWKGVQDAMAKYGVDGKYLESKEVADYQKNIDAFIQDKCDLIITVGYFLVDATKASAEANPMQKFSIVDNVYDPVIPNVLGQAFQTDEAAFMAGYVAADIAVKETAAGKTPTVGTYGGFPIPTVTIFMDGFARGVAYYNEKKSTAVKVIGWDINDPSKGLMSSTFDDQTKGKELGLSLLDEGAVVILPVAGPVGWGTAAAIKERGGAYMIGVDSDAYLTGPAEYKGILLTSVMKMMDATVLDAVKNLVEGTFIGGATIGNLANNGVQLAPFHDVDSKITPELKAELDQIKADLLSGKIVLSPAFKLTK
jgi:basic membrane protein A